jgi:hypothetical protein
MSESRGKSRNQLPTYLDPEALDLLELLGIEYKITEIFKDIKDRITKMNK